jgi:cell division protease FtsH
MGARIPKGILLSGHPGTGKTLLAKAVAGEANVPFYSISGSDFVEMFVGVGASRVRDMFKKAQQTAPCIIFIDEIDAVGRQRGAGFGGGHDEREQTLNQLLVEMDGMEENTGVVVIAATNRPDVLDPALLRAGRFDRQITVSLPDRKGREAILAVHARNKHFAPDMDLNALAKRTPGFSGADLENVLNESAIMAVRHNETEITMADVDEAIDRVMMGPAKVSRTYDDKTKKLVAYHEAGHAIVGLFMDNAQIVQKVTIIPRGEAGGYNLMTPKEEKMLETKSDLLATITSYMGGRVSEEMFFDDVTTGASNDIERATNLAKDMVTLYGMSDLGPIKYNSGTENVFLGRDYNSPNNVSGQVAFEIDQEVRKIVNSCHDTARDLLEKHKKELESIANALMEHETLTAEQINRLVKGEDISADFVIEKTVNAPAAPQAPETKEPEVKAEEKEPEPKTVPLTTEDDAKDASFKDSSDDQQK